MGAGSHLKKVEVGVGKQQIKKRESNKNARYDGMTVGTAGPAVPWYGTCTYETLSRMPPRSINATLHNRHSTTHIKSEFFRAGAGFPPPVFLLTGVSR